MSNPSEEPTRDERATGFTQWEQGLGGGDAEQTGHGRQGQVDAGETLGKQSTHHRSRASSRRRMLRAGLGVAAAGVGAGTLLELSSGVASAAPNKPGVFASNTAGTPAVSATGTNGAMGVSASSDTGTGVSGSSSGTSFGSIGVAGTGRIGVRGFSTLSTGFGSVGVAGSSDSADGAGVSGSGSIGVRGISETGTGVSGTSSTSADSAPGGIGVSGTGRFGVFGKSTSGTGVVASSDTGTGVSGTSISSDGVFGESDTGVGVHGTTVGSGLAGRFDGDVQLNGSLGATGAGSFASSASGAVALTGSGSNGAEGVLGFSDTGVGVGGKSGGSGAGVVGSSSSGDGVQGGSGTGVGVHGFTSSGGLAGKFDGDVQVNGNFSATGAKNFVQAHPSDPDKEIVYAALEGGEAGTYARGTGQLLRGRAVLDLPEHFGLVTATDGLTVQLTPRGEWLQLYVAELSPTQLVVREAAGKSGWFDYVIWGVRKGYEHYEVIRPKQ